MRRHVSFDCEGAKLVGTIDEADGATGLVIVSGGNEIRSGSHRAMATLAAELSRAGYPVFRYDRRGIGDSEGTNLGFENSAADLAAAMDCFRAEMPQLQAIAGYGNCDAGATLLTLPDQTMFAAIAASNPWTIDDSQKPGHSPAAARAHYKNRLRDPAAIKALMSGKVNLKRLFGGLVRAGEKQETKGLAQTISRVLSAPSCPIRLMVAQQDATGATFMGHWQSSAYAEARANPLVMLETLDSPSHSFASASDEKWLQAQLLDLLNAIRSTQGSGDAL